MIPVAEILQKTLKRSAAAKKIKAQFILDAWPDTVGEHIAKKSQAISLEKGIMYVRVCDSVWAQHLSLQKKQIINKLNRKQKTRMLNDIRFQVGSIQHIGAIEDTQKKTPKWRNEKMTEEELAVIEHSFDNTSVPDDLAKSMITLFVAQKKRQKWSVKQGNPVCMSCGLPLIQTAGETYCLRCKTEDIGQTNS